MLPNPTPEGCHACQSEADHRFGWLRKGACAKVPPRTPLGQSAASTAALLHTEEMQGIGSPRHRGPQLKLTSGAETNAATPAATGQRRLPTTSRALCVSQAMTSGRHVCEKCRNRSRGPPVMRGIIPTRRQTAARWSRDPRRKQHSKDGERVSYIIVSHVTCAGGRRRRPCEG